MSEGKAGGSGGFGAFLFGVAIGAVVGFFFAPEAGEGTRRKLSKQLRNLREMAEEKVDDVRGLLAEGEAAADAAETEEEEETPPETRREQLRRRLQSTRRRRRSREEDEPLA
ncbi:MAG: YtxH domain-containing protein [Gemmatimonadales bacterium]